MTKTLLLTLFMALPSHSPQTVQEASYQTRLAPSLAMNAIGALAERCGIRSEGWYLTVQTAAIRQAERAAEGAWGGTNMQMTPAASRHFDEALAAMATAEQTERSVSSAACSLLSKPASLSALDRVAMTMDVHRHEREPIDDGVVRTKRRALAGVGHSRAAHRPIWSRPRTREG